MSWHASIAYCRPNAIEEWNDPYGYTEKIRDFKVKGIFQDEVTDSWAYIGVCDSFGEIVVACRGTGSIRNFQTNLRLQLTQNKLPATSSADSAAGSADSADSATSTTRVDSDLDSDLESDLDISHGSNGRVHIGFYEASTYLYRKFIPTLLETTRGNPGYRVIFTGHSLGGAVASLTAYYAASLHGHELDPLIAAFAAPRIGDANFSLRFNETFGGRQLNTAWNLVHDRDPILHFNTPMWDSMNFRYNA
jgi:hypothetical protein